MTRLKPRPTYDLSNLTNPSDLTDLTDLSDLTDPSYTNNEETDVSS